MQRWRLIPGLRLPRGSESLRFLDLRRVHFVGHPVAIAVSPYGDVILSRSQVEPHVRLYIGSDQLQSSTSSARAGSVADSISIAAAKNLHRHISFPRLPLATRGERN
jgi:hypothetical protein